MENWLVKESVTLSLYDHSSEEVLSFTFYVVHANDQNTLATKLTHYYEKWWLHF